MSRDRSPVPSSATIHNYRYFGWSRSVPAAAGMDTAATAQLLESPTGSLPLPLHPGIPSLPRHRRRRTHPWPSGCQCRTNESEDASLVQWLKTMPFSGENNFLSQTVVKHTWGEKNTLSQFSIVSGNRFDAIILGWKWVKQPMRFSNFLLNEQLMVFRSMPLDQAADGKP